jgi:NADH dehydrogenase
LFAGKQRPIDRFPGNPLPDNDASFQDGAMSKLPEIVIVGGGFGGLRAARAARNVRANVTLLDRRNFHLFQPLLYQVATGELSPSNIASPIRQLLRSQRNCTVLMTDVQSIDVHRRRVVTDSGEFPFDYLVVACGASHSYFGNDDWESVAPGLKSIEQATDIRRRILSAFELAEREPDSARRQALLTFVIVGGGPTGVEMAGAISEVARFTLRHDFRRINPSESRVIVVEAGPRVLAAFPEKLSARAARDLQRLEVELLLNTRVTEIGNDEVVIHSRDTTQTIRAFTVIWAAGVAAAPLAVSLARATGAETDSAGRIRVAPDLTLPGFDNIFVIGDAATFNDESGMPLPGQAPVAMQQGDYVARAIQARIEGRATVEPFRYRSRGMMAVIGRYRAIAVIGNRQLSGLVAWLVWGLVHLSEITQFQNRFLVLMKWAWTFFTRGRVSRLITDPAAAEQQALHASRDSDASPQR